ncbi:hypothetical protein ABW21_db0207969 [Orbilia brochopaga]|nr:hypothetical protein ABW21_db0207969 [Drechslerella brochopaga]
MSTTQEDYFGDAIDSDADRRHRRSRHKHSKPRPRSHTPDVATDSEPDILHEEREYYKPGHRHRHRETVDTVYGPDSDLDGASTDDGLRKARRKKHRHRRRERIPDDTSSTIAEAESGTDTDYERDVDTRSTRSTNSQNGLLGRAKTFGEAALAALGLDEAYKRTRSRSRSRGRHRKGSVYSDEGYDSTDERPSRSRSRLQSNTAQAAIIAAVVEAFRARKEPGGVTGSKSLKRVVEAAVASGAVEKFLDRKGEDDKKSNRRVAEAVIAGAHVGQALAAVGLGGLAADRFGRSRRDSRSSRRGSVRDDTSSSDSSLSDSDLSLDEEAEQERHKRLRRKEIISVALAILAALHVGHVGYEAREKRALRKEKLGSGKISEEDADKLQRKAMFKDASAVGLAIFAAAEAVKSFKGMQKSRNDCKEFDRKHDKIEEHRRQKAIEQGRDNDDHRPQTPKGEASNYYTQPGYLGAPAGGRTAPAYPYYPAEGTIPVTAYVPPRDAYVRDGREIPVVYPSSVAPAY